ncbi:hypothetical protein TEA_008529 [Camellia sinensis var. sinensis]|uniref:Uncharacterized protein n=1 Tax=Camellia sinensis var. sinensis TaxID=542762 RepID=A0A4S4DSA5_CAMSN|nr:hypothetical protein TEA_008529 [Camellia sinensis var. sinensis]
MTLSERFSSKHYFMRREEYNNKSLEEVYSFDGVLSSEEIGFVRVIQNPKNYGALKCIAGIEDLVLRKQMESLESILLSMNQTLEHSIILLSMNKTLYILKASIVSALSALALKPKYAKRCSSSLYLGICKPYLCDLGAFQQLLVDQPNIPKEEVQSIFDIVFAEEIC